MTIAVETEQERAIRHAGEREAAKRLSEVFRLDENPGDRLIRVMAAFNTVGGYHPMTFPLNEVQSVGELETGTSVIVLRAGAEIPVTVPYEEIERKIYRPNFDTDDVVLDLRTRTGEAVKPSLRPVAKFTAPR